MEYDTAITLDLFKPFLPLFLIIMGSMLVLSILLSLAKVILSNKIKNKKVKSSTTTVTNTVPDRTNNITYKSGMYKKRPFLLTKNELAFYRELLPAAKALNLTVMAKVRLADLIEPTEQTNFWPTFNRISAKHIDFVLCDNQYIRPMLAVELDDASHQRDDRDKRDIFVDQALEGAGIPILHTLSSANILSKIDDIISKKGKNIRKPTSSPATKY